MDVMVCRGREGVVRTLMGRLDKADVWRVVVGG